MKDKNILIVTPYFYPEGGGLELYAFKIAKQLSKKNRIVVLCATKNQNKTEKLNKNLIVIREKPNFIISNTPINLSIGKKIKGLIAKYKINILNAHTPVPFYADKAAKIADKYKIPLVLHYHSSSLYKGRPFLDFISFFYENIFEKKLFRRSQKIISSSFYPLINKLSKYKDKTIFIPPPVNTSLFKFSKIKSQKIILFIGQLNKSHKWKGLDNLLEAFKILNKNYKLFIIGDGDYIEHYKDKIGKLNLKNKIKFLGKLNQKELINYYQKCFLVVIPSISNAEGTPTVLFEAMACGKPIIGGNVGGIPYILKENKCGIIVDSKNTTKLANEINNLIENKNLYKILSKNCLKSIKKYSSKKILKQIEEIYENVF